MDLGVSFLRGNEHMHSFHLGPPHLLLVMSFGELSPILEEGAWGELREPSTPCLVSWQQGLGARQGITPWGSQISSSKETSQGRKGRKPQRIPSFQERG